MIEPRSTATIRALASLAELSADQLEEGVSVEDVIATLRKAAEAVRHVVEADAADDIGTEETDVVQDLTPVSLSANDADAETADEEPEQAIEEEPVLNAG